MEANALMWSDPVPYAQALRWQESLHAARMDDRIGDTLLLLQHTPVITMGRRARDQGFLTDADSLRQRGFDVVTASRGGDLTCHGPGQWVLYPIIRLDAASSGAHGYLYNLEETAIHAAASLSVRAFRREGMSGAWASTGKFAAIGFHIKHWVTLHGMSVNVMDVPAGFAHIIPCGLQGESVSSLRAAGAPEDLSMDHAAKALLTAWSHVFGVNVIITAMGDASDNAIKQWMTHVK